MTGPSIGSSPRLRGTRPPGGGGTVNGRFIPAPAGNTLGEFVGPEPITVHPRACGEHGPNWLSERYPSGSSPRLRGTPPHGAVAQVAERFIPAPAGNTSEALNARASRSVHPRACGEHRWSPKSSSSANGSSPRLRGTRLNIWPHYTRNRFIPAPAGNTSRSWRRCPPTPVHPRACGEHSGTAPVSITHNGSSPRLRGTRRDPLSPGLRLRFIPAPAGNTPAHPQGPARSPVHPRACGEHLSMTRLIRLANGSSPRLRGTRSGAILDGDSRRFIPAPAGNTPEKHRMNRRSPVHPRACGEHVSTLLAVE